MKTVDELYNEVLALGYENAYINKTFAYSINKDKRYRSVYVEGEISEELIMCANRSGYLLVARSLVKIDGRRVIAHEFMPEDMKTFEFVDIEL